MNAQELKNKLTQFQLGLVNVDEKEAQLIVDIVSTLSSEKITMSRATRLLDVTKEVLPMITELNQLD